MANKAITLTGAALAGAVLVGTIGLVTDDDIQYSDSVKYHLVEDVRVPAHKVAAFRDSVINDSTKVQVFVDSVDVPEKVQRERAIYRTPKDSTYAVGDTVRMAIMVKRNGTNKWRVMGYSDKPITEPAGDGRVLKAYGRLVIHEDTEATATTEE